MRMGLKARRTRQVLQGRRMTTRTARVVVIWKSSIPFIWDSSLLLIAVYEE